MMVLSSSEAEWNIVDEDIIAADIARGTAADPAVQKLVQCFKSKDVKTLLDSLFDEQVYYKVRLKAAELIGELGLVEAIEPLRNSECKNKLIATKVRDAIKRIHKISGTRECPYCTEIIDAKATTCNQCGKVLN